MKSYNTMNLTAPDGGSVIVTYLNGEYEAVSTKGMMFVDGDIARSENGDMYVFSSANGFCLLDPRTLGQNRMIVRRKIHV